MPITNEAQRCYVQICDDNYNVLMNSLRRHWKHITLMQSHRAPELSSSGAAGNAYRTNNGHFNLMNRSEMNQALLISI